MHIEAKHTHTYTHLPSTQPVNLFGQYLYVNYNRSVIVRFICFHIFPLSLSLSISLLVRYWVSFFFIQWIMLNRLIWFALEYAYAHIPSLSLSIAILRRPIVALKMHIESDILSHFNALKLCIVYIQIVLPVWAWAWAYIALHRIAHTFAPSIRLWEFQFQPRHIISIFFIILFFPE